MGRRTRYAPGIFCWVALSTPDLDAATRFYRAMFGWDVREDGDATVFLKDGAVVAGLEELGEEQFQAGQRPSWSVSVAVDDAAATAARATELGGSVRVAPSADGDRGTMAVVTDPQGADLVLWQAGTFAGAELVNEVGTWAWNDLQTADPDGAADFYRGLLGWDISEVPGSGGLYSRIAVGDRAIGGIMQAPPATEQPAWMTYFGVASVGAALEHADAADGERLVDPFEVPAGRFGVASDPLGAAFSVVESEFDD
jgi:predicted enzyme related to lactoylglutathione lyase